MQSRLPRVPAMLRLEECNPAPSQDCLTPSKAKAAGLSEYCSESTGITCEHLPSDEWEEVDSRPAGEEEQYKLGCKMHRVKRIWTNLCSLEHMC